MSREMIEQLPLIYNVSAEVDQAFQLHMPIVALESAVITHGLPRPHNLDLALELESEIRRNGAVPATIALMKGKVRIGLTSGEIDQLANASGARKVSKRDFAATLVSSRPGGTTVAGTLIAARQAGIRVFATGGIGGVHRNAPFDVSADLPELGRSPLVVVCAGAKAILDLPATLEYLETQGIPVIGYQTGEFPAFYSRSSGLKLQDTVKTPREIAMIAMTHWTLGLDSAILVTVPPPDEFALPKDLVESAINQALKDAAKEKISGAEVTPFLLSRVSALSEGKSLAANLALLRNNARLAAQIAVELKSLALLPTR